MMPFNQEKTNCTGCSACYSICPKNCIIMEMDNEGFYYPKIEEGCIHCGACEKVCPQIHNRISSNQQIQKAFAAVTKDKTSWLKSTSGGAFGEIASCWGNDTIVYGASWADNKKSVKHVGVLINEIDILRKSKYIASSLDNCFKEIREHLVNGEYVVFSGTPCQVAGLKEYLQKDYERLLLIDLICHGAGSPKVFETVWSFWEKQLNETIESYEFRTKRGAFETAYISKITLSSEKSKYLYKDTYNQLFLNQDCLRPSCGENCHYRRQNREGDITIADFKGLTTIFPSLRGTKYNYSSIVINTKKGYSVLPLLKKKMVLIPCTIEDIKKYNPLFYRQTGNVNNRDKFFSEYLKDKYNTIIQYTEPSEEYPLDIKRRLYNLLPTFLRKIKVIIRG